MNKEQQSLPRLLGCGPFGCTWLSLSHLLPVQLDDHVGCMRKLKKFSLKRFSVLENMLSLEIQEIGEDQ